jgi:hypothetical protein
VRKVAHVLLVVFRRDDAHDLLNGADVELLGKEYHRELVVELPGKNLGRTHSRQPTVKAGVEDDPVIAARIGALGTVVEHRQPVVIEHVVDVDEHGEHVGEEVVAVNAGGYEDRQDICDRFVVTRLLVLTVLDSARRAREDVAVEVMSLVTRETRNRVKKRVHFQEKALRKKIVELSCIYYLLKNI